MHLSSRLGRCLPGLLVLAACAANPRSQAKGDASATDADAMVLHINLDVRLFPSQDTNPLLCGRTLSDQEQPGFPLDWATAQSPMAWCSLSGPGLEWSLVEDPGGYHQVVLGILVGGEMFIWSETIYLYDANTGRFVQELSASWDYRTSCVLRAADAPTSAVADMFTYHPGTPLQSLCAPLVDAGR
jgi:hypothetical protein